LSRDPDVSVDRAFFRQRIEQALAYRQQLVRGSNAYRLVSSEGDGLPGLIVDRYGSAIAVQTLSWAMAARQAELLDDLRTLLAPTVIVERNDARVRLHEGLEQRAGLLQGASAAVTVAMNGLHFELDLLAGQKTGGFLDQRENWAAAATYAQALGCRRALDVFTYQGGFALHLARAGLQIEAVDSSRPALEAAERNGERNGFPAIDWVEANAFDLLRDYDQRGEQFDCIVLDPPAFAKSRAALKTAAAGYKEINLRALKLLHPGGLLVTCSCSHHLSEAHLLEILADAARDARRDLRILERRGQAVDHPVVLSFPESAYLKCIVAAVQ
ncbi:MAG: class I SAM-dependent rRNA methyltransferase, partial [Terriglobales bacterium]